MAELNHVSHSQISMFLRCPRQWEFRYVKGLKMPPSGALILGSSYHKALEANFAQKVESEIDLGLEDVLDAFSDHWETRLEQEKDIQWEDLKPGVLKDQGISIVTLYHQQEAPQIQPVAVEIPYGKVIADTSFVGSVDLVERRGTVIDHKTSARAYNQDEVDKDIQATAEAFMVGRPINHEFHVAIKTKVPKIQKVASIRTIDDILWWLDLVRGVIAQMRSGIAPPNPTTWACSPKWCGFWSICRGGASKTYSIPKGGN